MPVTRKNPFRLLLAFACVALPAVSVPALAETVALIGTGNVGGALGRRFAENGHTVVYGSRDPRAADVVALVEQTGHGAAALSPADAAARSRVVVLAVPWSAAEDVVRGLGDLSGKILVDPTNPRVMASDGFADYPPALEEESMLDHRIGGFMNHNLGEYHVPVHADIYDIDVIFVEEEDKANPLGVKGLGEIGIVGTAAAIANAVFHATGRRVRDLPITVDKLL